ncbi:PREDICTED: AKT-interacting protein-like isoform X1 [Branchiostoma belcheri]|uniref:AKT-interacting protein-like isoform X1 n=1 Tax=Branchiostoma belcheri TaxID=7741 RepID=A0A6P4ZIV8_BRABE|nr:PREDICTED: AKT-interacting protein-like isoform X1 [Branchiostoma belcheri]
MFRTLQVTILPSGKRQAQLKPHKGSSGGGAVRSGVGRKQLPPVPPGAGAPDTTTPRAADRRSAQDSPPNGIPQSYGPFFLEYSLMAEYNLLQRQRIPGIYVIPSAKSPLFWFGVVFVRQGLFQEGVFKFYVIVPDNYPDGDCPRVIFDPPIFHPVVDIETGELDVKRGFTKWRRNVNHIWQVLLYVRRIFYKIDTKNPLNPEAAVLYDKELDVFRRKVTETIRKCNEHIYDPPTTDDPHAIRFTRWDPSLHEEAKKQVLSPKNLNSGPDMDDSPTGVSSRETKSQGSDPRARLRMPRPQACPGSSQAPLKPSADRKPRLSEARKVKETTSGSLVITTLTRDVADT